ncbi:tRNA (adenosine(37)-N6)-dimethylallyltransferase MiaA [Taylorella equigenitalis]|uniref:tRNA dimethylallyltransferase n=3 Tax=Taylorella equigenitalis TaxID=29575 RepID=A0A654KH77_TAYEM|nr:tRNA (adenosine(37)-N6)-dimethylallyltransferase MiaA [Taylorella equigenitalis]ADU91206.1 tRNA delta(2)-isopentenylpyrophosphate transferase [Taylorella equigenitalis MCE9]AFN36312.1 tRNA dimethylallyltransferase [Taylorella equigenitalis ATCC 35865]ASY30880.1 tRNA (adenosine(37)-N6)-dimethylallyltransferase MiaA [Taylorella equigenitalis]ASY39713.1 tRNA (adenosine(37)-N6)-dimethylallyltransferase MiaA [Taylorella equigenitalis]ASY41159.1 tRNA (adenosine(37)-N6)-dimethylallyltransferase Mi
MKIPCIVGPTATGKSDSALYIAEKYPIEIIVMDSATIYKGMDIGTAKPKIEELICPHHLLDIRDPSESYNASDFRNDTLGLINQISARNRIPVIVGGTMMYFKVLREGLHDLPTSIPEIRAQIENKAQELGWPEIHKQLENIDPVTASRLSPNDSQRISRAYEIYLITGNTLSNLISKNKTKTEEHEYFTISLETQNREILHKRIKDRFLKMMDMGFLNEVRALYDRGDLNESLPSIRCVGYSQLWSYLDGKICLEEAIEKGIAATRQLAKRQFTWLRSIKDREIIDCLSLQKNQLVLEAFERFLGVNNLRP